MRPPVCATLCHFPTHDAPPLQFVLSFLGGVLLSCLDAVFICWALDRDSQSVSKPEVYAVFQVCHAAPCCAGSGGCAGHVALQGAHALFARQ